MSQGKPNHTGHLFTVEILMEEATNGLAMEKLLHLLNTHAVKDYKIVKGIELGKLIELNTNESTPPSHKSTKAAAPPPAAPATPVASPAPAAAPTAKPAASEAADLIIKQLEGFRQNNTLIRLTVIKGQGIKLNLPCRILNYDSSNQNVTVYHVDEKKVYSFKLNEIDDYIAF